MSTKEQILQTVNKPDEAALTQLLEKAKELERQEEIKKQKHIEETIALWEAFAEPMDDSKAEKRLFEALERRPWFGGRTTVFEPDES